MNSTIVNLSDIEISVAAHVGCIRMATGLRHNWKGAAGTRLWDYCIEAAASEYAVAKFLGVPFNPNNIGKADIIANGVRIEVRTVTEASHRLRVEKTDTADTVAVLVYGRCPTFDIVGWIPVAEAKQPENLSTDGNFYFIRQSQLSHPALLRDALTRKSA